jgi:cytidylate kinase
VAKKFPAKKVVIISCIALVAVTVLVNAPLEYRARMLEKKETVLRIACKGIALREEMFFKRWGRYTDDFRELTAWLESIDRESGYYVSDFQLDPNVVLRASSSQELQ